MNNFGTEMALWLKKADYTRYQRTIFEMAH